MTKAELKITLKEKIIPTIILGILITDLVRNLAIFIFPIFLMLLHIMVSIKLISIVLDIVLHRQKSLLITEILLLSSAALLLFFSTIQFSVIIFILWYKRDYLLNIFIKKEQIPLLENE